MKRLISALALLFFSAAASANIVYTVNETIGSGTVTGFIETDGSLGQISFSNFVDFHFTLTSPNLQFGTGTIDKGDNNSYAVNETGRLFATANDLSFDPSNSNNNQAFIIFWDANFLHWWCIEANRCSSNPGQSIGYGINDVFADRKLTDQQFVFASVGNSVPEPGSFALIGGALIGLGLIRRRRNA